MPDERPVKPNIPYYKLKVLDKTTQQKGEVGAGWLNEDGSISIRLNPCIVLHPNPNQVLTLFANDYRQKIHE